MIESDYDNRQATLAWIVNFSEEQPG